MRYTIAGIAAEIPDEFAAGHFGAALERFATPGAKEGGGASDPETGRTPPAGTPPDLDVRPGRVGPGSGFVELSAFDFRDADADCRFGCDTEGYLLEMTPRNGGIPVRFRKRFDDAAAATDYTTGCDPSLLRFGIWTMFNLAALRRESVAFHASVIDYRGRGILCLGESGTGKSTHTRLWREHIAGAGLLNDDSPIIRADGAEVRVCGSPWSGKTPCYRNRELPVAGIIRLSQAPRNRIRRLRPLEAIGALLPSCPPAFARDERLQDLMCGIISKLVRQVPVYHLECLPDADAARLARDTVFPSENDC